jgi:hypothetical protein
MNVQDEEVNYDAFESVAIGGGGAGEAPPPR